VSTQHFELSSKLCDPVIGDLLRARAGLHPDKRLIVCGDRTITYADMDDVADRLTAGFSSRSIATGDRVALLAPNRPEMFELYFGLARLGAIQVPLNAFIKGEFLRYQLADSGASALVTDAPGFKAALPLLSELPDLRLVVLLDDDDLDAAVPAHVTLVRYEDVLAGADVTGDAVVAPASLMTILYTSGTTGLPKGCMLTHGYYLRVGELVATAMEQTEDDVLFTALPVFHAFTQMMVVAAALTRGSTAAVEPAFHPTTFVERAFEVGATLGYGVGTTGVLLLASPPGEFDRRHHMRAFMLGPFSPEQQDEFSERYGLDCYAEIFGQTECVGVSWSPVKGPRNHASVGLAGPDLEVVVLDDDGEEVPRGHVGEICLRPRHRYAMFDGYWRKPEATLEAMKFLWYHTGDYGRQDEDGFFAYVDRKKDAIRRRGENISSYEMETAIAKHPAVREVAAHAVKVGSLEDEVMVVIALEPGATVEPAELHQFFRDHLPYYAVPRYVRFVDELPRNAVMRVMKYHLRELPLDDAVWDFNVMGHVVARDERR